MFELISPDVQTSEALHDLCSLVPIKGNSEGETYKHALYRVPPN